MVHLLTSHLQTLAFWRRNDNNRPTLSWQTCPHARACPDVSLARVFALCPLGMTLIAQGIQLAYTHKTYAKTSAQRRSATDRLTFGTTLLAMFDGCTSLCLLLLEAMTFPGPLCSLLTCILDLLTLLPPLVCLHNMCVIMLVGFQHSLISCPQSKIAFIRLAREQKLPHGFIFIVASHVEEVRKK